MRRDKRHSKKDNAICARSGSTFMWENTVCLVYAISSVFERNIMMQSSFIEKQPQSFRLIKNSKCWTPPRVHDDFGNTKQYRSAMAPTWTKGLGSGASQNVIHLGISELVAVHWGLELQCWRERFLCNAGELVLFGHVFGGTSGQLAVQLYSIRWNELWWVWTFDVSHVWRLVLDTQSPMMWGDSMTYRHISTSLPSLIRMCMLLNNMDGQFNKLNAREHPKDYDKQRTHKHRIRMSINLWWVEYFSDQRQ